MPIDKLDFNYKYVMTVQHNLNVLHLLSFVQQVSKYSKCLEHKWYFGIGIYSMTFYIVSLDVCQ